MLKPSTDQMRNALLGFAKAVPMRAELKPHVLAAIGSLREQDMKEFLWILGRPAPRWKLLGMMSPTIGADRAFAALNQLPEINEMPVGLRMGESFRKAKSLTMSQKGGR